ncbi:hypothetical protein ACFSKU_18035 [Pontibacter silvestris]|uniref:Uncharacterized protein n=1 Tax=Pontibacter silvestris TaxID=2305183 RepID=A0ABW4X344_9BACT|nr:hypothetical protein [Pontibacter silvestris]MCC9138309.1 hypothetical protein [Pontibacter silvestris]
MQKQKILKIILGVAFSLLAVYKTYQLITADSNWVDQLLLFVFVVVAIINFMTLEDDHD